MKGESNVTFRTDTLHVISSFRRHFHLCSNETCDIQVQFEVQWYYSMHWDLKCNEPVWRVKSDSVSLKDEHFRSALGINYHKNLPSMFIFSKRWGHSIEPFAAITNIHCKGLCFSSLCLRCTIRDTLGAQNTLIRVCSKHRLALTRLL